MFRNFNKSHVLISLSFLVSACSNLSPAHLGRFTFEGLVKDEAGKPIPHAWVKVRGWETLSDANGKWREVQVVDCGTLTEHVESYEENDEVLITADGFRPKEEKFIVKHPGYFQSCNPEQVVHFDSVLTSRGAEVQAPETPTKKPNPPSEQAPAPKNTKGSYSI
ncbi:MAG: carboxypeptidase regulatory-like domain-containing protein [Deltaproteobacteria bacterium]|nr:carboxypeptidase regulatory-like domain-containing protein [Deltaproteobacteria bacterium]